MDIRKTDKISSDTKKIIKSFIRISNNIRLEPGITELISHKM